MLLKLLLFAIVMILGFSATLGGALMASASGDAIGWVISLVGLVLGIYSLVRVVQINRGYQDHHLDEVLGNPSEIIARWPDPAPGEDREIIVAVRGVFLGRDFAPFAGGYQSLAAITFDRASGALHVEFSSIAPPPHDRPTLDLAVPEAARDAIGDFVDTIRDGPR
ncbi:MAG: hypothetical protein KC486_20125 [Myxococcales bacterium]|nr:hypothetical protein [Myxococcales bacterium]